MPNKGLIFDLDGVIVDTARYHYIAWKQIADELKIPFGRKENELLKGVSRQKSLEIILTLDSRSMTEQDKEKYCRKKNDLYISYIRKMKEDEILPNVRKFIESARKSGYKAALGSASKNANLILENLKLKELFDVIIDGNKVSKAKPDPEVFVLGAKEMGLFSEDCIVFEDSKAGISAAHGAGMKAVGIGRAEDLADADIVIPGFTGMEITKIEELLLC